MQRPALVDDILGLIGNTPLVRLRKIAGAPETHATVWGKCEMLNPGGSVKDRIALAMIEAAEATGQIVPGKSVLVEPTSGNTGIGLALVAAVKGYRLILTMPESMSLERRNLLKAYGAEIVLTPEDQTMGGAVGRAVELCKRDDHVMLQQFENPANPEIHRRSTALEILDQLGDRTVDGFVSAVGTGGTITGVGQVLREAVPGLLVVAMEPAKSRALSGGATRPHGIEGIGAGFVPGVLDRENIDEVLPCEDRVAFAMAQRLAREEGISAGISGGAAVWGAIQVAERLGPGKRVVTVIPDAWDRYISIERPASIAGVDFII
jgi:cysteine synthase A